MDTWTGQDARWLREALRMPQRDFAAHLGVADRTVTQWEERGSDITPRAEMQRALDTALARADEAIRARFFARRLRSHSPTPTSPGRTEQMSRFLGEGQVVIAAPVKHEQIRSRPVIAVEDVIGSRRLGQTAQDLGLKVSYESIHPNDTFDVNRSNVVAICGPRISPTIGAVLETDPVLRFVRADRGHWMLRDISTGSTYTSGIDQDPPEPYDYAYLGRLQRPDGQGTIMILTGIHPQGSLGVIDLICSGISDLYAKLETRCFSVLLRCKYDPYTSEPITVERLTPFYQEHTVVD